MGQINALVLSISLSVIVVSLLRVLWILPVFRVQPRLFKRRTAKLVIVLGSGGHTAEMLRLLEALDFSKYTYRLYIVSRGDTLSEGKARAFELRKSKSKGEKVVSCTYLYS